MEHTSQAHNYAAWYPVIIVTNGAVPRTMVTKAATGYTPPEWIPIHRNWMESEMHTKFRHYGYWIYRSEPVGGQLHSI